MRGPGYAMNVSRGPLPGPWGRTGTEDVTNDCSIMAGTEHHGMLPYICH